ncbi:DNA-binding response regulator [Aliidongia dinghuensis]|uniref:DNA-binding response regulator n=1 Tax=Aliidongia dinghuensis TaxID=1867774 RepID=A0A8J2YS78_9PROT|nr:response regulator transcription factor [Aliidongia dinghuensis]GGF12811.1 DNA-binding response regulator [Aliidongia dinghuensis]
MKILIIDDHPLLRAGLARLLTLEFQAEVAEAGNAAEGWAKFCADRPDVTVLDLNLPDQGGLSLLPRLRAMDPRARIVILSMHEDELSTAAGLRGGATAYLSKSAGPEIILEAVRAALAGRSYVQPELAQDFTVRRMVEAPRPLPALTPQETELLRLIVDGRRIEQIARSLGVSEKTVANRKSLLRSKLDVATDVELMKAAISAGMVTPRQIG